MPFIVHQNTTFTTEHNENAHIQGNATEGLNKYQYTAHIFINAGEFEDTAHDYIDLICRGKGTYIPSLEKESYHESIDVPW
jgi:hypothetical protein